MRFTWICLCDRTISIGLICILTPKKYSMHLLNIHSTLGKYTLHFIEMNGMGRILSEVYIFQELKNVDWHIINPIDMVHIT